jgi:hypothetical protein
LKRRRHGERPLKARRKTKKDVTIKEEVRPNHQREAMDH